MTSCLVPLAEVHGKHVVTIEGCNLAGLNLVQEAVVEFGGTQCGFCTPGIVVSLHGLLLDHGKGLTLDDVKYALSGHLCRCTGYRSLKDCAATLEHTLGSRLQANGAASRVPVLTAAGALPEYFTTIPERLRALRATIHAAAQTECGRSRSAESVSPASAVADEAAPSVAETSSSAATAASAVSAGSGSLAAGASASAPAVPPLLIAGGTDLYVQQGSRSRSGWSKCWARAPELKGSAAPAANSASARSPPSRSSAPTRW